MKQNYFYFLLLFIAFSSISYAQDHYYWYRGEKVTLRKNPKKTYITFDAKIDTGELEKILGTPTGTPRIETGRMGVSVSLEQSNNIDSQLKWAIVETLDKNIAGHPEINYSASFYWTGEGVEAGLSNLFYVKLKSPDDRSLLLEMASEQQVEVLGQNKYMPLWYTLSCNKTSKGNALEMANFFFESKKFQASEPDLMTDDRPLCTNDQLFNNQWGLNNTGQFGGGNAFDINYCAARQTSTGSPNVIVAVVDQGVELNHPDLPNMHALSYNSETNTSPSQVLGDHGTAVAGIIGANENNTIGVAGIAPDSPIMSISNSLAGTPNSRQRRADGINFAVNNGASVINNSWGSAVAYQIIDDAIDAALTQGRGGLGCVVVFASGNDNGGVNYPANSNPDILTVGAMSPCGERKNPNSCDGENWGSNFGAQLDIMAPGVLIPTTDRQGTAGYNNAGGVAGNYIVNFNGTSSAAPHVAGVAALVLSVNPNLTGQQVRNVIETTAQKVGGYNYANHAGRPNGTWDDEMGYGLLDADAALEAALLQGANLNGPSLLCSSGSNFSISGLPSGTNITWTQSSNITRNSSQGSNPSNFSANSSGNGWVRASLNNGVVILQKNLWAGTPIVGYDISEDFTMCRDISSTSNNNFPVSIQGMDASTTWQVQKITNNHNVSMQGNEVLVSLQYAPPYNYIAFKVRASNACGFSNWLEYYVEVIDFCGSESFNSFVVYPNPASEIINISAKSSGEPIDIVPYQVYDFSGTLIEKGNLTHESAIEVSRYKKGTYLLKIDKTSRPEIHKVIIH